MRAEFKWGGKVSKHRHAHDSGNLPTSIVDQNLYPGLSSQP